MISLFPSDLSSADRFFSSSQCRNCSVPECPSAMLTSPFIDLFTDPHFFVPLFSPKGRARNIRAMYVTSLIGGSFLGAGLRRTAGSEATLWVGVALKVMVLVWAGLVRGEKKQEEEELRECC